MNVCTSLTRAYAERVFPSVCPSRAEIGDYAAQVTVDGSEFALPAGGAAPVLLGMAPDRAKPWRVSGSPEEVRRPQRAATPRTRSMTRAWLSGERLLELGRQIPRAKIDAETSPP